MFSLILTTALMSQCQPAGCWRRGWFHHRPAVCWSAPPGTGYSPVYAAPVAEPSPAVAELETASTIEAAAISVVDPYGFTAWLNATRAAHGLHAVGYSANLTAWAAANNAQQVIRGPGNDSVPTGPMQDAAMGPYHTIVLLWMGSPPHRAALLDPTIRQIGIAGSGAYWTYNAE